MTTATGSTQSRVKPGGQHNKAARAANHAEHSEIVSLLAGVQNPKHRAVLGDLVWLTEEEAGAIHGMTQQGVSRIARQNAVVLTLLRVHAEQIQAHDAQRAERVAMCAANDYLIHGRTTRGGVQIESVNQLSSVLSAATQASKIAKSHAQPGPSQDDPLSDRLASADAAFDAPPDRSTVPVSPPISGAPNATDTGAST